MSSKCLEQNLMGCFCMLFCQVLKLDLKEIRRATGSVVSFYEFPEGGRSGTRPTVLLDCGLRTCISLHTMHDNLISK